MFMFLVPDPREIGIEMPEEIKQTEDDQVQEPPQVEMQEIGSPS